MWKLISIHALQSVSPDLSCSWGQYLNNVNSTKKITRLKSREKIDHNWIQEKLKVGLSSFAIVFTSASADTLLPVPTTPHSFKMPPKGWKKHHEPSLLHEEVDLVSIDDILFPRATIQKSIRAILDGDESDKMTISKDSLIAIQRAATVFVSHLQFHARLLAKFSNRKNVYASDILAGLENAGFAGFVPRVKQLLAAYEEDVSNTRRKKAEEKELASTQGQSNGEEPAIKKVKVEGLKQKQKQTADNADGSASEDEQEDAEDTVEADDDGLVEEEDGDEEDATTKNPIALLNKEQDELAGTEPEALAEAEAVDSEGEDSS